jgi:thiol-disulfide isomerase/thioredoxin
MGHRNRTERHLVLDGSTTTRIAAFLLLRAAPAPAPAPASAPAVETRAAEGTWDLPPLQFETLAGDTKSLSDWRGKVILLSFWATWCGPCQAEIPHLVRYQTRHGKEGLQVVGVALDDPRKVRNVARTLGINYPVMLADPSQGSALLPQWGNRSRSLPFTVVIGRGGRINLALNGILDEETFTDSVQPLLEETPFSE